jgi:outer membrane lipoprotein-sorting protein
MLMTRSNRLKVVLRVSVSLACFVGLAACSACGIRRTVRVEVPEKILQAKTAGFDKLLALVNVYADRISSLSSSTMKATYTSGKLENGVLQTYRSAPGYVLLRQPDKIRINIQNPITKTSIAEMLSVGNDFQAWVPSKNKLYFGKNNVIEFVAEGQGESASFTIRPVHIYDAIVPAKLVAGMLGRWVAVEEEQDTTAKYYVLTSYREIGSERLFPLRKIWIDRSNLTIVKQQFYEDEGRLTGIVHYSDIASIDGIGLPLAIKIERPVDGYTLDLTFKTWNLNPDLEDTAFILTAPEGAERIELKEKGRSQ